jgi:uncharacterized membrane protein YkvA (DUF1232 family)
MFRLLPIRSLVIPFLKLVWRLFIDKRVPTFTKIIPLLALVYVVSPYDIVGDRIPVLGQLDDVIVVGVLFLLFIAASPNHVIADQTIGRKLRDLQRQQGNDPTQDQEDPDGKTVDAEIRFIPDDPPADSPVNPNDAPSADEPGEIDDQENQK